MLWDEFVVCDVDQEILLKKAFDSCLIRYGGDDLQSRCSDSATRNEDTCMIRVPREKLGKGAHLLNTDVVAWQEFDPDLANIRRGWVWLSCSWKI